MSKTGKCLEKAVHTLKEITFKMERIRTALRANQNDVALKLANEVLDSLR